MEHNDKSGDDAVKCRKRLVPAEALRLSELGRRVLEEETRSYPEVTLATGVYTQNQGHRVNECNRFFRQLSSVGLAGRLL